MRPRKRKKQKLTKSEQMARVRNKDTEPEIVLRKSLWKSGLRYRLRPSLTGTPDLAFIGRKVAIFVDGCFCGTLNPSRLQLRSTLLWLTLQPARRSKAVTRR